MSLIIIGYIVLTVYYVVFPIHTMILAAIPLAGGFLSALLVSYLWKIVYGNPIPLGLCFIIGTYLIYYYQRDRAIMTRNTKVTTQAETLTFFFIGIFNALKYETYF